MKYGFFITGTGTDIGKTYYAKILAQRLQKTGSTAYFKPILSGKEEGISCDTQIVSQVLNNNLPYEAMTPYSFRPAASPHLAAQLENKFISISHIKECLEYLKKSYEHIICEGAGGLIVPIKRLPNKYYTMADLAKELQLPLIIVSDAGLGTINHTCLTVEYARNNSLEIDRLVLNNYDNNNYIHRDNLKTIAEITKIDHIETIEYSLS